MMINHTTLQSVPLGAACELRITIGQRFDVPALRGIRRAVGEAGEVSRLELDFSSVTWLDAAALRLLADDLAVLERLGVHVVARRLPKGLAERLARHPLSRFTSVTDQIFTDPDRHGPGFLPSER